MEELKINILEEITSAAKIIRRSGLGESANKRSLPHIKHIADYLAISDNQAILFSAAFVLCFRNSTLDLGDLAVFLHYDEVECLSMKSDLDYLFNKDLLIKADSYRSESSKLDYSSINFRVNSQVCECIFSNVKLSEKRSENLDVFEFVSRVSKLIQKRAENNFDTDELFNKVIRLEDRCNLTVIKKISKLKIEDRVLLYEVVDDQIAAFQSSLEKTLKDIFSNNRLKMTKFREFIERSNGLLKNDLVTLNNARFANDFNIQLTDKAIKYFFEKDADLFMSKKKSKNILSHKDITRKELFYDNQLAQEIDFLTNSLQERDFKKLQERMSNMALNRGVAAIFYGSPGTGKTESVYQIAKQTGRDIMKVDVSQSKSMWFGESEKRVKEIFDSYNRIAKSAEKKPILLFNEADALFSMRKENTQSSTSNTENTIQNIILDEMERFEGIMIATTNLQGNLDSAYERRFLFKVKFDNPSAEIKVKIWQSKLNWMQPEFASSVAKEYSFSGGEIDNIVRKITMKEVITGIRPDENAILQFCKEEKLMSTKSRNYIGFTN